MENGYFDIIGTEIETIPLGNPPQMKSTSHNFELFHRIELPFTAHFTRRLEKIYVG